MKKILISSAVVFACLVGVSLAGSGPARSHSGCHGRVAEGCHGQEMVAAPMACHGATLKVPAVSDAGCHGGRLTLAERRTARSSARSNYRTTLSQFKAAGRAGNVSAMDMQAPTMQLAPVCQCSGECTCQ
jgi:hypothetical protein